VPDGDWVHALWESDALAARVARVALTPAELLFGAIARSRDALYSSGIRTSHETAIPAISIGNLTVGGTGKTPLAAYMASRLREAGARPAIVLRGYGDDEPLVHRTLNPEVPVVVAADRLAGIDDARRRGCDVAVLDDAFQHRRAKRVADIVVVSADSWHPTRRRLLPAGPWRERLTAARRASLAIVTRKAARADRAASVVQALEGAAPISCAVVHLDVAELRTLDSEDRLDGRKLQRQSVLAVSAIGDPTAFVAQLEAFGATVDSTSFRDHHRFTAAEAATLARTAERYDLVVCTLKDAVKLGPLWPRGSPLWYVSQRVVVERGGDAVDAVLAITLRARSESTHSEWPGLAPTPD
jgi:tetraacyldisaccharide 4'-kinase